MKSLPKTQTTLESVSLEAIGSDTSEPIGAVLVGRLDGIGQTVLPTVIELRKDQKDG